MAVLPTAVGPGAHAARDVSDGAVCTVGSLVGAVLFLNDNQAISPVRGNGVDEARIVTVYNAIVFECSGKDRVDTRLCNLRIGKLRCCGCWGRHRQ